MSNGEGARASSSLNGSLTRDIDAFLRQRVVPAGGSRHGVVIGIEQYRDARLNLRCARADAKAVHALMTDAECGLFPKDNVRLLLDADATRESIRRAFAELRKQAGESDTVWVYYAGHAAPEGGEVYWLSHDADVDDLYGTGFGGDELRNMLSEIRAQRLLVLLDCCHAAATALQKNPSRAALNADEVFTCYRGKGRLTLASSDGKEKSVELAELGHGAFTHFLERGLRGEADASGEGVVTADNLWAYLRGKVDAASRSVGKHQTPVLIGEITHDFPLTLNAVASRHKKAAAEAISKRVGVGNEHLTTDEANYCLALLKRTPQTAAESDLAGEFEAFAADRLSVRAFKRLIAAAAQEEGKHQQVPAQTDAQPITALAQVPVSQHAASQESPSAVEDSDVDVAAIVATYALGEAEVKQIIDTWSSGVNCLCPLTKYANLQSVASVDVFYITIKLLYESRSLRYETEPLPKDTPIQSQPFNLDIWNLPFSPPGGFTPQKHIWQGSSPVKVTGCGKCGGTGQSVCKECNAKKKRMCHHCDGTGRNYLSDQKCDHCKGAKEVPCKACGGADPFSCGACGGRGQVAVFPIVDIAFDVKDSWQFAFVGQGSTLVRRELLLNAIPLWSAEAENPSQLKLPPSFPTPLSKQARTYFAQCVQGVAGRIRRAAIAIGYAPFAECQLSHKQRRFSMLVSRAKREVAWQDWFPPRSKVRRFFGLE